MGFLLVEIFYGIWYASGDIVKTNALEKKPEIIGNLTFWHLVCQKSRQAIAID
jgi:hypothetical protein